MSAEGPMDEQERYARDVFAGIRLDERAGFRNDLRSRLLAQVGPVATGRRSTPWWALRVPRVAVAAVAILAMLVGGSGLAAAGSLPGEPLFALKRAAEEVALAIAPDAAARVERLADQAAARVAELERAGGGDRRAAAALAYAQAVERLAREAGALQERGSDVSASARAASELDRAVEVLTTLEASVPEAAQEGIRRAIEAAGHGERPPSGPQPTGAPGGVPAATDEPSPSPGAPSRATPTRPAGPPEGAPPGRPASPGAPTSRPTPPQRSPAERTPQGSPDQTQPPPPSPEPEAEGGGPPVSAPPASAPGR